MADVLADQVVAGDRNQVAASRIAQAVEDVGHPQGHGGLARARIAGEAHVQGRRLGGQPHGAPGALHHQQGGGLADTLLDRRQADELAIQRLQHLRHPGLLDVSPKVDKGA